MFRSDGDRRSFSLTRDITVVGRREDCDLRIPLAEVSRKHCRLVRDGDSLRLEDLGSSNGTYHNAQRVQEALLRPGDSIQVGPLVFVLQVDGVPADDELSPVDAQSLDDKAAGGMGEEGLLEPTAQSEVALPELPTIDEGLHVGEQVEEYEPLEEVPTEEQPVALDALEPASTDVTFAELTDDAPQPVEENVDLGEEPLQLDEEENQPHH